jgi:D-amino-acid dehydrogenase
MARTDVVVLGAGIIGTAVAVHLAKRGRAVALIDRGRPGEGTSYGNAGVIEGNTIFPPAFPKGLGALLRVALKRAPEANYHLSFLPQIAPWLFDFWRWSQPERLIETARLMRPFFARAIPEHEALLSEANASAYLRRHGWLKLYRSQASFDATALERKLAADFAIPNEVMEVEQALKLEPSLRPVFRHAVFWRGAAAVTNPLAVTRAYAALFARLGGVVLNGDARSLHRNGNHWRIDTEAGPVEADEVVVALGPWSSDVLRPLGIRLPMAVKRGYHQHFHLAADVSGAGLSRTVLDADYGYVLAPMEQGIRLTTGVEFAPRDAAPTPVQFGRLMPGARQLLPLGEPVEPQPWMGCRPAFADSRPVIDRAPGQPGLWLALGHGHWGLTFGPATGRLLSEMMSGAAPFMDPAPFRADRFG